jgi:hypothetical protein
MGKSRGIARDPLLVFARIINTDANGYCIISAFEQEDAV